MATGDTKKAWKGNGNGLNVLKTNQSERSNDVTLSYEGKRSEADILATLPATMEMVWQKDEESSKNRLYYGDNFPVLATLLQDPAVRSQVRLVYIDPPFATNSIFKSRSQIDAYHDLLVGAHYLEFMRERLIFLRELLAEDGSIYVHLDDNMAFDIKVILDEIFGRRNFRNFITRRKCNPKNFTRKMYGNISDYIFFYTKSDNYVWNRPYEAWTDERAEQEYSYTEAETGRRFKKVPIHAPGVRNGETGKPWRNMLPPPGKHWQFPPHVLEEMDAKGEIFWSSNGNPRRKIYLENSQGIPIQDIWWDVRDAHNQNIRITGYPTEKNPDLLGRIISASCNSGDLVLDCFSGSGTTLAAASRLNRHWLGIDNSPQAIAATLRRFAIGTEPMGDFVKRPEVPEQLSFEDALSNPPMESSDHTGDAPEQLSFQNTLLSSSALIDDFTLFAIQPYSGDFDRAVEDFILA